MLSSLIAYKTCTGDNELIFFEKTYREPYIAYGQMIQTPTNIATPAKEANLLIFFIFLIMAGLSIWARLLASISSALRSSVISST